jgi:hypothetical protein
VKWLLKVDWALIEKSVEGIEVPRKVKLAAKT